MNGDNPALTVLIGQETVAQLILVQEELQWQYTPSWLAKGFPVSPHLPFGQAISSININRFLRNMLPEGQAFEELIHHVHVSRNNTFALVRALGMDTPGALAFTATSAKPLPSPGQLRILTEQELIDRLNARPLKSLVIWDGKPRLSVAGIQDKLNLIRLQDGRLGFGEDGLCSTHILKFQGQSHSFIVLNEFLTMSLARLCGLVTAKVSLQRFGKHPALLVERFDRKLINNDLVKRRHLLDGCQALNLAPEYKYERNFGSHPDVAHIRDGASLPALFEFASCCQNPAMTKQQIVDWVLFNILTNNFDAHGKNISFFISEQGISLAPFYDLVNIKLYPDVEQSFAMALGDAFEGGSVNAYELADFSDACQLSRRLVAKRLGQMIPKMRAALSRLQSEVINSAEEQSFWDEYQRTILSCCDHLQDQVARIAGMIV